MLRRISQTLLTLVGAVLVSRAVLAQSLDPRLHFRTIATEHFRIYFHQGEDARAARLARIAEEVRTRLGIALGLDTPRLTHVILADQDELSNGFANPLPYNTIFLTAAAPSGSEFVGHTDDWLRLVFTHEYTHIVHLDRSEGWARVFRHIFGRTPIAFLSDLQPNWQIEGLAVWEESRLTGLGRLTAGDFRAIEGEAARSGRLDPIDRANGGLTDWPGGTAQYAYGLGFMQYLADRYGEQRFGEWILTTARTAPFFGQVAFRNVFGTTLPDAWKDYLDRAAREASAIRPGTATPTPVRLTHHGNTVLGPRFAPPRCAGCPAEIIYSVRGPHLYPALYAMAVDGSDERRLERRTFGATSAATSRLIVFDQQEARRNAGLYSDLYWIDRRTDEIHAMTHEARLLDPDLAPDGRSIICVRESNGNRDLMLVDLEDGSLTDREGPRVSRIMTLVSEEETQFDAPRWAPDGRRVAVTRHRLGRLSELVVVDVTTRSVHVVASHPTARIVTPTWRPDGKAIVAAADFDRGTFNLYEFDSENPSAPPRPVTETTGGALWPDISADGQTLVFAGYTADGYDLFTTRYAPGPPISGLRADTMPETPAPRSEPAVPMVVRPYSPWGTLRPVAWSPTLGTDPDSAKTTLGIATGGVDVLGRHSWGAGVSWIVNKTDDVTVESPLMPDWALAYSYDRWVPRPFVSATSDMLLYRPSPEGFPLGQAIRERQVEAGVFLPVLHTRASYRLLGSLVNITDDYQFPTVETRQRAATRFGVSRITAQQYGYSISQERGTNVGGSVEHDLPALSSTTLATTTVTADARAYVPGFAPHQVLALRAGVGYPTGDTISRRAFLQGGAASNVDVVNFSSEAFSLNRGFAPDTFSGSHIFVINVDYRWPITRPQRGFETYPFFLHTIYAAVFADAGNVWSRELFAGDLKTSFGGELAADVVLGFNLRMTLAGGLGWGHDWAPDPGRNHVSAYVRIGKAF